MNSHLILAQLKGVGISWLYGINIESSEISGPHCEYRFAYGFAFENGGGSGDGNRFNFGFASYKEIYIDFYQYQNYGFMGSAWNEAFNV